MNRRSWLAWISALGGYLLGRKATAVEAKTTYVFDDYYSDDNKHEQATEPYYAVRVITGLRVNGTNIEAQFQWIAIEGVPLTQAEWTPVIKGEPLEPLTGVNTGPPIRSSE